MTMYGRNDGTRMAAWSAEEERRRANERAARARPHAAEDADDTHPRGVRWRGRTSVILGRLRRALGR